MTRIVHLLMLQGYGFACATCKVLQDSVVCGQFGCHRSDCFGPIRGGDFPRRDSEVSLSQACFVCGGVIDGCVKVRDKYIGICGKHISMLETYSANGERPPFVTKVEIPTLE